MVRLSIFLPFLQGAIDRFSLCLINQISTLFQPLVKIPGASAIQIIEALGKEVEHLTVFQRTPNLATPMRQTYYSQDAMAQMKENFPDRFAARYSRHGFDMRGSRSSWADSPEEREIFYSSLWETGGLAFWLANCQDTLGEKVSNARA